MKFILALILFLMPALASAKVTQLHNPDETKSEFAKTTTPGPMVIFYFATWCGACEGFKPTYEKLSEVNTEVGIRFFSMDCDVLRLREHANTFHSIPTVYVGANEKALREHPCEIGQKSRTIKDLNAEIAKCLGH